jgi:hypothetical protein
MIAPRTTTSKNYPKFIRENKFVKKYAKQKRIFTKLGLKNCSKKLDKKRSIVFSSEGNKALWDIATMSMRGISSCQRWGSGHSPHLIGSMIDPCLGIIYITSGKDTKYGKRMTKRALVRFVISRNTKKPVLLLERVYPDDRNTHIHDYEENLSTMKLFIDFLEKKTKHKIPIISVAGLGGGDLPYTHHIPYTKPVIELKAYIDRHWHRYGLLSYRDSGIGYVNSPKYRCVSKVKSL